MRFHNIHINIYGSGLPLVMFHGWGFDQNIWHPISSDLQNCGYQVYLIDLPGFGLSEHCEWEEFKNLLLAKLPNKFIVLGWSMGGLFATRLALEAKDRVIQLINVASSPKFIQDDHWPGVTQQVFNIFYDQLSRNPDKTLRKFVNLQVPNNYLDLNFISPSLYSLKKGLDVLLEWDLREHLHHINMPVSYIFGNLDTITPRAIMTTMQEQYPSFNYSILHKSAHIPFLSHPNCFIQEIKKLINTSL